MRIAVHELAFVLGAVVALPVRAQLRSRPVQPLDSTVIRAVLNRIDSTTRPRVSRIAAGVTIGAGLGATAGYGLALLGHRAFCEGQAQCAATPTRAIRASLFGGAVIGGLLGAAISITTAPTNAGPASQRRRANER
jgi:hypothetical protein